MSADAALLAQQQRVQLLRKARWRELGKAPIYPAPPPPSAPLTPALLAIELFALVGDQLLEEGVCVPSLVECVD